MAGGLNMLKFMSDRGGNPEHGGQQLSWPGHNGLPFAGDVVPDMRQKDLDDLELRGDFKSRMFSLWIEKDKAEFDRVNDRATGGWYVIRNRKDFDEKEHGHLRVWLEWVQYYWVSPTGKRYDEI